jgi:aspartate beta-hydroxylase
MLNREAATREQVVQLMKAGGFWSRVMDGPPELERVRVFLRALAGQIAEPPAPAHQRPWLLPIFPGLSHRPVRERPTASWVDELEQATPAIRDEALRAAASFISYNDYSEKKPWTVYPLFYMGTATPNAGQCPQTSELLQRLPGACLDYAWGDAIFSAQGPGSHLTAHCSVDNLRVRCHLGLVISPGCSIRVGHLMRTWREAQTLFFEDSFEHEVWNRGEGTRIVLIVDLWHPDLTDLEIEVLKAGFRLSKIRELFTDYRLPPQAVAMRRTLSESFEQQDQEPLMKRYWDIPRLTQSPT